MLRSYRASCQSIAQDWCPKLRQKMAAVQGPLLAWCVLESSWDTPTFLTISGCRKADPWCTRSHSACSSPLGCHCQVSKVFGMFGRLRSRTAFARPLAKVRCTPGRISFQLCLTRGKDRRPRKQRHELQDLGQNRCLESDALMPVHISAPRTLWVPASASASILEILRLARSARPIFLWMHHLRPRHRQDTKSKAWCSESQPVGRCHGCSNSWTWHSSTSNVHKRPGGL